MQQLEAALIPDGEASVRFVQRECNWLQALEGDIDTSHFAFPFWTQTPNSDFLTNVGVRGWVPMDDTHAMVVMIGWSKSTGAYTGIRMVFMHDQAVTESMGGITDHSFEHLVPSDQMVARTRRRVLRAAQALRDNCTPPPGVTNPEVMWRARSGSFLTSGDANWQEACEEKLKAATRVPVTT